MDSSSSLSDDTRMEWSLSPEFQLDLRDLLEDGLQTPPKKRQRTHDALAAFDGVVPFLPAPGSSKELFQVTHSMRAACKPDLFGVGDDDETTVNNAKIAKLVSDLGLTQHDYELDDELRTRIYLGRFKKGEAMAADELDLRLNAFLDKENIHADPAKHSGSDKIRKSSKVFFQAPTRPNHKTNIPVLRPLSNLTNLEKRQRTQMSPNTSPSRISGPPRLAHRSPNRICAPKRAIEAGRSCLRHQKELIYIVELLTGLVNDATQFATELNSSNCEGFPLPENTSEVVQIPTNEEAGKKKQPKMALIKGVPHSVSKRERNPFQQGFYTRNQFDAYRLQVSTPSPEVDVETQHKRPKKVLWAPDLVW